MAFDTGRNALVMFGGTAGGSSNFADTWTWDSATGWNLLPSTVSPSARHAHSMSYDPVRREMLVHGGNTKLTKLLHCSGICTHDVAFNDS
jgi:hypothetical protein